MKIIKIKNIAKNYRDDISDIELNIKYYIY